VEAPLPPMPPKASLMAQLATLVARHTALGYKDPQLYLGRTIGAVCNVAFLGLFFIGAMPRTQEQIFNRFMFMFTALIGLFGGSVLAVLLVNAEAKQVALEVRHAMYGVTTYVVASTLIQLCAFAVMGALAMLPAYGLGAWDWESFGALVLLSTTWIWVYEVLASLFALINDPKIGFICYAPIMGATFWFAGIVLRGDDLIWPLRLLYYALPSKWFMEASIYLLVVGDTFEGATTCPSGAALAQLNGTDAAQCSARPFYCPDGATRCYGATGTQVLDSFSRIFPVISSSVDWVTNWAVMMGILVALKLLFTWLLHRKATRHARLRPLKREVLIAEFKALWQQARPALSQEQLRSTLTPFSGTWSMTHNLDRDEWLRKGRILGLPSWMAAMNRDATFDITYGFDFTPAAVKVTSTVHASRFFKNTSNTVLYETSTHEVNVLMFAFGGRATSTIVGDSMCTEMVNYRIIDGKPSNEVTSWQRQYRTQAGTLRIDEYTFTADGDNSFMRMECHPVASVP